MRAQADLRIPATIPVELDCRTLAVKGELPPELDGVLLRIGPDSDGGDGNSSSDSRGGQPYVAALRIRHGHAEWYRTRRVRTDEVCRQLGELPSPGPRRCASDHTGAAVIRHGRRILALGDGALPYELTADLRTRARCDFDDTLPFGFSARPIHDPLTGELFAAVADIRALRYVTVDVWGRVRGCETIPVSQDPARYAFALTERHAVFLGPGQVGILPREGGAQDVRWIATDAAAVGSRDAGTGPAVQPVNAFETRDGGIAVDLLWDDGTPGLWRRRIDPIGGVVRDELIDLRAQDLPSVDERYQGSTYRHVVTRLLADDGRTGTGLIRYDLANGTARVHHAEPDRILGAPVFVPYDPTAGEGAGWVLAFARDTAREHDEVVVIDTADFTGPPVAVIELPGVAPRESAARWLVENPW